MAKVAAKTQRKAPAKRSRKTAPATHDPLHVFREEMNELFDRVFGRPLTLFEMPKFPELGFGEGALIPRVDVVEGDKEVRMTAELPGLDEKDIEMSIVDGTLTLTGEKRSETERKKGKTHVTERHYGRFHRSFSLPTSVDQDKIAASYDKGVLTVTMPKRPEEKKSTARKIRIS